MKRRFRLDLNTKSELAISNAINEIGKLGADEHLTNIILSLSKAKDDLSDYIDKQISNCAPINFKSGYLSNVNLDSEDDIPGTSNLEDHDIVKDGILQQKKWESIMETNKLNHDPIAELSAFNNTFSKKENKVPDFCVELNNSIDNFIYKFNYNKFIDLFNNYFKYNEYNIINPNKFLQTFFISIISSGKTVRYEISFGRDERMKFVALDQAILYMGDLLHEKNKYTLPSGVGEALESSLVLNDLKNQENRSRDLANSMSKGFDKESKNDPQDHQDFINSFDKGQKNKQKEPLESNRVWLKNRRDLVRAEIQRIENSKFYESIGALRLELDWLENKIAESK